METIEEVEENHDNKKKVNGGHEFRLQQIAKVKEFFEQEIEARRTILKKYKKTFEVMSRVVHFLAATEVVSGSFSIISLAGVITAPVGLALGWHHCWFDNFIFWSEFRQEKYLEEDL